MGWANKSGVYGIAYLAVLTFFALVLSFVLAKIAYRTVEKPSLTYGHRIANGIDANVGGKMQIEKVVGEAR